MKYFLVKASRSDETVVAADSEELIQKAFTLKDGDAMPGRLVIGECVVDKNLYGSDTKLLSITELTREQLERLAPESLKFFEENENERKAS